MPKGQCANTGPSECPSKSIRMRESESNVSLRLVHEVPVRHLPTRWRGIPVTVLVVILLWSRIYPTLEVSLILGR